MTPPPTSLGAYELLERIGQGGMGEVWRARHRTLGRAVAIKLIRAGTLGESVEADREVLRRFEREAHVAAALRSPHAIQLLDFGVTSDGAFFQAMELLDGLDLRQLVERFGPVPPGRAVALLRQAADALGEAHALGFVHRDVKPSNLFLCRLGTRVDFLKVLDFGLARSTDGGDPSLTRTGGIPGSPATLAPEVLRGQPPTDKADVYALGCVATWLLTGHLPFEGASAIEVIVGHLERAPAPLVDAQGMPIPPALAQCVQSALAKDPTSRPSIRELSRALAATGLESTWTEDTAEAWWALHQPAQAPRAPTPPPSVPFSREQAYARLRRDFEASRINVGEYERRMSVARVADSPVQVLDALRGLPEEPAPLVVVPPAPLAPPAPTTTVLTTRSSPRIASVLSAQVRRGAWRPESYTEVAAVMGSVELDLSSAVLEPGMTELHCSAFLGAIEITVPQGLFVEIAGSGFLGSFEGSSGGLKRPGDPWIRVTGNAVLGSVEVRVRR
jgi:serine/threonine protein kinase